MTDRTYTRQDDIRIAEFVGWESKMIDLKEFIGVIYLSDKRPLEVLRLWKRPGWPRFVHSDLEVTEYLTNPTPASDYEVLEAVRRNEGWNPNLLMPNKRDKFLESLWVIFLGRGMNPHFPRDCNVLAYHVGWYQGGDYARAVLAVLESTGSGEET